MRKLQFFYLFCLGAFFCGTLFAQTVPSAKPKVRGCMDSEIQSLFTKRLASWEINPENLVPPVGSRLAKVAFSKYQLTVFRNGSGWFADSVRDPNKLLSLALEDQHFNYSMDSNGLMTWKSASETAQVLCTYFESDFIAQGLKIVGTGDIQFTFQIEGKPVYIWYTRRADIPLNFKDLPKANTETPFAGQSSPVIPESIPTKPSKDKLSLIVNFPFQWKVGEESNAGRSRTSERISPSGNERFVISMIPYQAKQTFETILSSVDSNFKASKCKVASPANLEANPFQAISATVSKRKVFEYDCPSENRYGIQLVLEGGPVQFFTIYFEGKYPRVKQTEAIMSQVFATRIGTCSFENERKCHALAESANLDIPYPEQDLAELEKELDQSRWFYERVDRVVFVDRDSSGPPVINYGGLPTYSVCQKSSHKNYFDFILNNADKKKTKKSGEYCNLFTENSKPIFQCAIQEVGEERSLQRFFKSQAECNEIRTAEVELKSNN